MYGISYTHTHTHTNKRPIDTDIQEIMNAVVI